jgi:hypothetical protein
MFFQPLNSLNAFLFDTINMITGAPSAHQIIDRVWLGDSHAALSREFIDGNHINVIVNCTVDIPFADFIDDRHYVVKRLSVEDSLLEKDILLMETYFMDVLPFLLKEYKQGKVIFLHCFKGKQRSAIVMAAFLKALYDKGNWSERLEVGDTENASEMDKQGIEEQFDTIFHFICSKRPSAFMYGLRANFKQSFLRYFDERRFAYSFS